LISETNFKSLKKLSSQMSDLTLDAMPIGLVDDATGLLLLPLTGAGDDGTGTADVKRLRSFWMSVGNDEVNFSRQILMRTDRNE
jgi:hypothetical protein